MDYYASKAPVWLNASVVMEPTFCNKEEETNQSELLSEFNIP